MPSYVVSADTLNYLKGTLDEQRLADNNV